MPINSDYNERVTMVVHERSLHGPSSAQFQAIPEVYNICKIAFMQ